MIQIQSPTRVDLAGGTLDCWPLWALVGDCQTINLSIDVFTGAHLTPHSDQTVSIDIEDLKYQKSFKNFSQFLDASDPQLLLLQKVLAFFKPKHGFSLKTFSKSPVGGGLGGSSSLCISLIKAMNQWLGHKMNTLEMVELAHNLEAKVIKNPTGTQDYFPAIEPGLNIIHYESTGPRLEHLNVDMTPFQKNMFLVYTGKSHHSGINNWQVIRSVMEGDQQTLSALKEIAAVADDMAETCREENWAKLPELFRAEFDARVRLCTSFSSPEIEQLEKIVKAEKGDAVKICGAGGGGCVLVWAENDLHQRIMDTCRKKGFQPIAIQPVTGSAGH